MWALINLLSSVIPLLIIYLIWKFIQSLLERLEQDRDKAEEGIRENYLDETNFYPPIHQDENEANKRVIYKKQMEDYKKSKTDHAPHHQSRVQLDQTLSIQKRERAGKRKKVDLKKAMIYKEILGPPRVKKPYRFGAHRD